MGFHEIDFAENLDYGTEGGPSEENRVHRLPSGALEVVSLHDDGPMKFNAAFTVRTPDDIATLQAFYRKRRGVANGFRYKDWNDYTSAANGTAAPTNVDQNIGTGNASATTFQLVKKYVDVSLGLTRVRNIRKPVAGTVSIAFDGVNQASGWTVDTTTGVVTFSSAPGSGVAITAGFEFKVPVRFAEEVDFEGLIASRDEFEVASIRSIPLVEDISPVAVSDEYNFGGSSTLVAGSDVSLSLGYGRLIVINPSAGSVKHKLPSTSGLPLGCTHFMIHNISANSALICDAGGTTLYTLTAGKGILIGLEDVSGVATWFGLLGA